jgi:hypothetical protein
MRLSEEKVGDGRPSLTRLADFPLRQSPKVELTAEGSAFSSDAVPEGLGYGGR